MRRLLTLTAAAGILMLPGCSDGFLGLGDNDFEGYYSYAGTVDDAPGDVVVGEIIVTRQRHGRADVDIDWSYIDNGVETLRIRSEEPAIADLDSDGWISFDFEGEIFAGGHRIDFRLTHDGRLRGRTITGSWRLHTDVFTNDRGSFTARRD